MTATHDVAPATTEAARKPPQWLVLAALIFPVFMGVVLPALYLTAFHQPVPNHMKVDVVASSQEEQQQAQALQVKAGDAFEISVVDNTDQAKADVQDMTVRGSYVLKDGTAYVASAGSLFGTQTVEDAMGTIAKDSDQDLTVHDLKPLPDSDSVGLSLMFMGLGGILAGFITATLVNMAGHLDLRRELAIYLGVAVLAGVVTTFIGFAVHGAFSAHLVPAALTVAAGALVAALVQGGGFKVIGPGMVIVGVVLFIFVGIPASGASIPVDMTPRFFQVLHPYMPTASVLELLRRVLYFGSAGAGKNIVTLVLWAAIAAGLYWIGHLIPGGGPDLAKTMAHESDGPTDTVPEASRVSSAPSAAASPAPAPEAPAPGLAPETWARPTPAWPAPAMSGSPLSASAPPEPPVQRSGRHGAQPGSSAQEGNL
jgi:hypothetical protein